VGVGVSLGPLGVAVEDGSGSGIFVGLEITPGREVGVLLHPDSRIKRINRR
jgi:hypothetical protein